MGDVQTEQAQQEPDAENIETDQQSEPEAPEQQVEPEQPTVEELQKKLDAQIGINRKLEGRTKKDKATMDDLQRKLEAAGYEEPEEVRKQREADHAAVEKANNRIRSMSLKLAAKGKLSDPSDASKFIDMSEFDVDDDGEVDEDAISAAVDALVKSKPYLAAKGGEPAHFESPAAHQKEPRGNLSAAERAAEAERSGDSRAAAAQKAAWLGEISKKR